MEPFTINAQLSAGKKDLEVRCENEAYTLIESGSIVGILKFKESKWQFTTGSYSDGDAQIIGNIIQQHTTK